MLTGQKAEGAGIYLGNGDDYLWYQQFKIVNCTITDNIAIATAGISKGGGLFCERSVSPILINCKVSNNSADKGGAMFFKDCNPTLVNCLVSGNISAPDYGCICCDDATLTFANCTIVGNNTFVLETRRGIFTNSIIYNNNPCNPLQQIKRKPYTSYKPQVSYCCIQNGWPGQGNIDTDPCFIAAGYWDPNGTPTDASDDFWVEGDYRLRRKSACVDSGDPMVYIMHPIDLAGEPRFSGAWVDIGAYEFQDIPAFEAQLKIIPDKISPKSKGCFIMAILTLPPGVNISEISHEPLVFYPGGIASLNWYPCWNKLIATFDRSTVLSALPDAGTVEVEVIGLLSNGQYFYGTDSLRVMERHWPW
jgi:hypothetical protein